MTELTDLSDTDAENVLVTGEPISGQTFMSRTDNVWYAVLGLLSRFRNSNVFRLRDATDKTKLLALDLSGLTTATTRTLTVPNRSGTLALTNGIDTRRNRIVNHDMRVSQENGTTAGTTNGRYPVDQWAQYFVTSAGVLTVQQVASVTPAGSPNRLRATVTTADASLAAGEYWTLSQNLEGSNVADFRYGSASAFQSVLRFGFRGPAGTYAVHLGNSAANRSFVALFTIAAGQANTDTVQTIAIPGDTTGTWLTADGVIGITLDIVLAAGSTFQGVAGWQAGNVLGTSAVSNGMASAGAVFELFDVGLRLDPDATGVYGQYEVGEMHPRYNSLWYFEQLAYEASALACVGVAFAANGFNWSLAFSKKAKTPTLPSLPPATLAPRDAAGAPLVVASTIVAGLSKDGFMRLQSTTTANGLVAGNAVAIIASSAASVSISARLS